MPKHKSTPESLLQRLHDLQWDIYNYQSKMEDKGHAIIAELAGESGFERDVSQHKMQMIIDVLNKTQPIN